MPTTTPPRSRAITLPEWRRTVAGLTLVEVARATGLSVRDVQQLELFPHRASLGALRAYVAACDGTLELLLHHPTETLPRLLVF